MASKIRLSVANPNGVLTVVDENGQEVEGVQSVRVVHTSDPATPHTVQITLEGVAVNLGRYEPLFQQQDAKPKGKRNVVRMEGAE